MVEEAETGKNNRRQYLNKVTNYSKYKDRDPRDTILEIQRILHDTGLYPVLRWAEKSYEGARTNRVTLFPTELGSNGKGTDELYASASGYAELMERLQNNLLMACDRHDSLKPEAGFEEFPDEELRDAADIIREPDPFTEAQFAALGLNDNVSRFMFLDNLCKAYGHADSKLPVVPYADPVDKTICRVPVLLVLFACGSNGMAAGNTLEEAMVQGLSELFERAVNRELLSGNAVPPEIPDEELRGYSFYHLIEQVREESHYRVTVLDCSLGKGYPVAGLCIADTDTGTFGIKLGAHPSFAVAVERTLTEALQGKNMEVFTRFCRLGTADEAKSYHNLTNLNKVGLGIYPASMFSGKPGWEYRRWTGWEGKDNREFLKGMLELMKREDLHVMVRDTSFLGFPTCQIIVPGFSEQYVDGARFRRAMNTSLKVIDSFSHFPDLSEEEEHRLLNLILFNEGSFHADHILVMSGRQLGARFSVDRIAAFLSLKYRKFSQAKRFFAKLKEPEKDPDEIRYLDGLIFYSRCREQGLTGEQTHAMIRRFLSADTADRVIGDTRDLSGVMQEQFPLMKCYDCENCEAGRNDCVYPAAREIIVKAAKCMKAENVSQDALLEELIELMG